MLGSQACATKPGPPLTILPPLQASRAVRVAPHHPPQRPEKRRVPHLCLSALRSLASPGQGHPLSSRILPLQAPAIPGETCPTVECGPLSPLAQIPPSLPGLMTLGQQDPSPQKTPGHLPPRWTTSPVRNRTWTRPGKNTGSGGPQVTRASWQSAPRPVPTLPHSFTLSDLAELCSFHPSILF